jgi:hypothetical protein
MEKELRLLISKSEPSCVRNVSNKLEAKIYDLEKDCKFMGIK